MWWGIQNATQAAATREIRVKTPAIWLYANAGIPLRDQRAHLNHLNVPRGAEQPDLAERGTHPRNAEQARNKALSPPPDPSKARDSAEQGAEQGAERLAEQGRPHPRNIQVVSRVRDDPLAH